MSNWTKTAKVTLETRYAVNVHLELDGSGRLVVTQILVPKHSRRQGVGTQVMADILALADHYQVRTLLTPTGEWGSSPTRLTRWYRSMGFKPNSGRSRDLSTSESMYRDPR